MVSKNNLLNQYEKIIHNPTLTRWKNFKLNFPELANDFKNYFKDTLETDKPTEIYYRIKNDILEKPKCPVCGNLCSFKNLDRGYKKYCTEKCRKSEIGKKLSLKIRKNNSIKKYGVDDPSKTKEVRKKFEKTMLLKYGVKHALCLKENKNIVIKKLKLKEKESVEKAKQTNLKKYGVTSVFLLKENQEKSRKSSHEKSKKYIKEKYGYDIDFLKSGFIKVHNGCKIHGDIEMPLPIFENRIKEGRTKIICPICNPIKKQIGSSFMEKYICNFLKNNNINFIQHDRKILNGKELDIFIPDKNLAIECNGVYWHSEIRKPNKNYHQEKTKKCAEKNIQLIQIWEDDFNDKLNIIMDSLKSKLGLLKNKIYARKCEIKNLDSKETKQFLIENHIQGNVNSHINLGLTFNNKLVAVMTFGGLRKSLGQLPKEGFYELYRYATLKDYEIIGGGSKLLSYFKKNYIWKTIISYAKYDFSNGNFYKKLGFTYNGLTAPNYTWLINFKRENRFKYRKSEIIDETNKDKTEKEIMWEKGYYRCFDSGNLKFILENKNEVK